MSYSPPLLSRFQGSLCGRVMQRKTLSEPEQGRLGDRLYTQCLQTLLQQPTWNDWAFPERLKALPLSTLTVEEELLGLVPLVLYTHEIPTLFGSVLGQLSDIFTPAQIDSLRQWFQLLRGAIQATRITPDAIATDSLTPQINHWLDQGTSWQQVQHQLPSLPLPSLSAALYCFVATPADYRLTVARAQQYAPTAGAIAATLSGAYNGTAQIPWDERQPDLEQDAAQLYSRWMGAYLPPAHASPLPTVGAALTLQPRPMQPPVSLAGCEGP